MSAAKKKSVFGTILRVFITIIVILLIAAFIAGYIFTSVEMNKRFKREDYPVESANLHYTYSHYEQEYPRQEVSFRSGDNVLKGYIYGLGNDKGVIIFSHGLGSGHESYLGTITALVDCGWRVFAYDGTGSCSSDGKTTVGLAQSVIDLDKAVTYVENNSVFEGMPIYTVGHSWGGYAAAAIHDFDHDIAGSVSISGYRAPFPMLCEYADNLFGDKSIAVYPFMWLYNKVKFGRYSDIDTINAINKKDAAVLIIHGDNDDTVKYDGASIMAASNRITSLNVEKFTFEAENKDTHAGAFHSTEYYNYYTNTLKPKYDEIDKRCNGDWTDADWEEYVALVDKSVFDAPNPDLIKLIDDFCKKNIPSEEE